MIKLIWLLIKIFLMVFAACLFIEVLKTLDHVGWAKLPWVQQWYFFLWLGYALYVTFSPSKTTRE